MTEDGKLELYLVFEVVCHIACGNLTSLVEGVWLFIRNHVWLLAITCLGSLFVCIRILYFFPR